MIKSKGFTDVTTYFKLVSPTTGAPVVGATITNLDMTYTRDGALAVKSDVTALASADAAHGDNKMIEVDGTNCPGLYRADWPDAAFATGVNAVQLCVNGSAIDPAYIEVELVDYTMNNAIKLLECDMVIDKTTDPAAWRMVFYEKGTSNVLMTKLIKDINGAAISDIDTPVGRQIHV
jgi:hypothetical protein